MLKQPLVTEMVITVNINWVLNDALEVSYAFYKIIK